MPKLAYKKYELILTDIVLFNLALLLSFFIRFDVSWSMYSKYMHYSYFIIITIISITVLHYSGLYNKMWQYASIGEVVSVLKSSFYINLGLVLFIFLSQRAFPRSVIFINFLLNIFVLGASRFGFRFFTDFLNSQDIDGERTKVLIIGAGDAGEIIIREMQKHPELKKEVIGLIDDNPHKHNLEIHGVKVMGTRKNIPEIVESYAVDEIIIAIPSAHGKDIKQIYEYCNETDAKVSILPGMYELIHGDINLNQIREVKVEDLLGREQIELNTEKISNYVKKKVILVTGAGGSIGSELCRQLAEFQPEKLLMLDIYENNLYFLDLELRKKFINLKLEPIIASIRDKNKIKNIFKKYQPDVVFHAAAHKHVPLMEYNPEEAINNNIFGTRNLIEISNKFSVERFVLISTDKAVNPTNVMGASKRVAEMFVQTMNKKSTTKYMAVRFGNVLGSQGSVIPLFKKQIAEGGPVTVTHPDVCRYFMTISEAVQLVIQAGSLGKGGEVFVLDMGNPVKILDLAYDLIKLSGLKVGEDIDIEIIGLRPGEKLFEELLNNDENNISTEHERIYITHLEEVNEERLNEKVKKLGLYALEADEDKIILTLIDLINTYKPNRSELQKLAL